MRILPLDPLDRVTGSCYLVHIPSGDVRLLVDCGAYQDGLDAEVRDDAPFPFDPAKLTAVLLTHAHYDHCGRLPRLVAAGFRGSVIATEETIAIAKITLEDSFRVRDRPGERGAFSQIRWRPFGTHLFARPLSVTTDVFVSAHRSGHILGAVSMELVAGPKEHPSEQLRVLFSGDIGNNRDGYEVQPFLRHVMHPSETANVAVMESTYGATRRPPEAFDAAKRRAKLGKEVRAGLARGGPVIIPVFAVQRAQDVLWDLHLLFAEDPSIFGDAPIFLDAPMALELHPILREALGRDSISPTGKARPVWLGRHLFRELGLDPNAPNDLRRARGAIGRVFGDRPQWSPGQIVTKAPVDGDFAERVSARWWRVPSYLRDSIIADRRPCVVLATAGMANAGPVQDWLSASLKDPQATVLFSGYCGRGTLGAAIAALEPLDVAERRRLEEPLPLPDVAIRACDVAAHIHVMSGYSAHADQHGLVEWAFPQKKDKRRFPVAKRVLITHGEATSRRALRAALLNRAAASGFTMQVDLPRPDGPGIDVGTGEPVAREEVLGTRTATVTEEVLSLDEARRELAELRAENARLRARPGKTEPGASGE